MEMGRFCSKVKPNTTRARLAGGGSGPRRWVISLMRLERDPSPSPGPLTPVSVHCAPSLPFLRPPPFSPSTSLGVPHPESVCPGLLAAPGSIPTTVLWSPPCSDTADGSPAPTECRRAPSPGIGPSRVGPASTSTVWPSARSSRPPADSLSVHLSEVWLRLVHLLECPASFPCRPLPRSSSEALCCLLREAPPGLSVGWDPALLGSPAALRSSPRRLRPPRCHWSYRALG